MNSYNNNNRGKSNSRKPRDSSGNNSYNRSGNFKRNNFSNQNREMHKATCNKCKKECEVPFKPTEGKPVFCKECFMSNRSY